MQKSKFILGCDVSNQTITCCLLEKPGTLLLHPIDFANNTDGFEACMEWIKKFGVKPSDIVVCMEHTGVYSESFSYYLYNRGIKVILESGAKIKSSFKLSTHKTDEIDSIAIAEYAYRYLDRVSWWQPRNSNVEKMKSLLSGRDLLIKKRTSIKNALAAVQRKIVKDDILIESYVDLIEMLTEKIETIKMEMELLISTNIQWQSKVHIATTIPGVGDLISYNVFVLSNGFSAKLNFKKIAAYLRICPYQYQSGSSVYKKSCCPKYGPELMRGYLHLAARSVSVHNKKFRKYYQRKKEEGKPHRIILNNISNKLIKIICAVVNSGKVYIPSYCSVNPKFLK